MNPQRSLFCPRSIRTLALLAIFGAGLSACHQSPLHRSFGVRYKEMWTAQSNARPTRDVATQGEEAARAVRNYHNTFDQADGGAVGKDIGGGGQGQMTAGVMPMH